MNASLFLDNLLAWSAQIAILVAAAALVSLALKNASARLIFWQGVLAIALLLPLVEPWSEPPPVAKTAVTVSTGSFSYAEAQPSYHYIWKREYFLGILAAGVAIRLLMIVAGLLRLRRHRLEARLMQDDPPVPFERTNIRWYTSSTISGPVTFGWMRPSILLPERVQALAPDLREAIACHELIHVRRHDWLVVLGEEFLRGVLWFHPAIWFALSRIQLAREQVVDAEAVRLTDRGRYLDALVAVAAQRLEPDVAPAPLFLKKRQLAVRVAAILNEALKEGSMSRSPRTFVSLTTVFAAALVAARLAVWVFPLQTQAQTMPDSDGVIVDAGAALMHRSPVYYPRGATSSGTVLLEANIDSKGEVTDAHVVSGPEDLRKAALQSVLGWHYSIESGATSPVRISIQFAGPQKSGPALIAQRSSEASTASEATSPLAQINFINVPQALQDKVNASLPVHVGDQIDSTKRAEIRSALEAIDEHLMFSVSHKLSPNGIQDTRLVVMLPPMPTGIPSGIAGGVGTGVGVGIGGGVGGGVAGGIAGGIPTPQSIRVGENAQAANLIRKVVPDYPPLAKQARIQGVVRFTVTVGPDGTIQNLQLVSGHPLLVPAAQEALRQWTYKPTLLNGNPVAVTTTVDINFTLSDEP